MTGHLIGYVLLTKRQDVDEEWWIEHIGRACTKDEAIADGLSFVRDNHDHEYAVAAVVLPGEDA